MEVPPPAPRSFLCRALCLFPRVFAAEAVTADSEVLEERQKRLPYVPEPYYPESGWDRLRELFGKDTPVGGLLMAFQKYSGETVQERKQKDRKALHELKLEEWKGRLQVTEHLPEKIESSLQENEPENDAKKIEALLNLPRNPSVIDKQDKD
ncbi:TIMMDC1 isoform 2 [Pan troglodytes]|uniref:Complex I assembly factor TIMMDC1, mitochondrial n=2 Tax=Pan troglodytes TaxID=9598 RepID=A0A6D2WJU2_PANTR|nr:TIMMDC1 isoform 2 [Pan troglodytes]